MVEDPLRLVGKRVRNTRGRWRIVASNSGSSERTEKLSISRAEPLTSRSAIKRARRGTGEQGSRSASAGPGCIPQFGRCSSLPWSIAVAACSISSRAAPFCSHAKSIMSASSQAVHVHATNSKSDHGPYI